LSTVVTTEEVVPDFAKVTLTPGKASLALSKTVPLMIAEPDEQQSTTATVSSFSSLEQLLRKNASVIRISVKNGLNCFGEYILPPLHISA
jgi:hypothetical protein